jgi:hypothetical protein
MDMARIGYGKIFVRASHFRISTDSLCLYRFANQRISNSASHMPEVLPRGDLIPFNKGTFIRTIVVSPD